MTRDDIFTLHAEISSAEIDLLEKAEINPHDIKASLRKGQGYAIQCNTVQAVHFYQKAINNITDLEEGHKGFTGYRHDEKRPGHQIVGYVHTTHWKNREKFHISFCAASQGAVKVNQVIQYRPALQDDTKGMIKIFLEIDDQAFEWLRSKEWRSRIGGIIVPWRAPNLPGLTGIFRPDEDVQAIKTAMIASYNNFTSTDITDTPSSPTKTSGLSSGIELLEVNSVKTLDTDNILDSDDSDREEADKTIRASTPVGEEAKLTDTPVKLPQSKIRRSRTDSGGYMTDVSDLEAKLD